EDATAMLFVVWHDRFQAVASSDETTYEEDINSAGSWKGKRFKFRQEIDWLIRTLPSL
ncbi:hypothetical protein Dimus_003897, partial [Dionaea muscipula]